MSAIRVLVADDSPFVCCLLTSYLQSSPGIEVVAAAQNGARVLQLVEQMRPDVVTMDLEMPEMDGLEALERVMREFPTPVVVISGLSGRAAGYTMQALELGAVDFILKYLPGSHKSPETLRREIIATVRAASQTSVVRLRQPRQAAGPPAAETETANNPAGAVEARLGPAAAPVASGGLIVIGASAGGPLALRELLSELPAGFPAAIVIVQHMPATFSGVLAAHLDRYVPFQVRQAQDGDRLRPGVALVAPGGRHLLVAPGHRVSLRTGPEIGGYCPSIDATMQSAARIYGPRVKGVVLTGMGDDGAMGLLAIHAGGGATYAQDADSCVVDGMPMRAIEKGVVDHVAPPGQIAELLRMHQAIAPKGSGMTFPVPSKDENA